MITIYVLKDPRELEIPRYVGVTSIDLEKRLSRHIWESQNKGYRSHKTNWINKLLKEGVRPVIFTVDKADSKDKAFELERYWIKEFNNQSYPLVNGTDGGQGLIEITKYLKEVRSLTNIGRVRSQETRDKISRARKGKKTGKRLTKTLGRPCKEETKIKLSLAQKGRVVPQARLEKIRQRMQAKKGLPVPQFSSCLKKVILGEIEFESIRKAYDYAIENNIISCTYGSFGRKLSGNRRNETNFTYKPS